MNTAVKSKGTWIHRFAIRFSTVVLTILIYWLLGFLVSDIKSIEGPDYLAIEGQHLDPSIVAKRDALELQIGERTQLIANLTEKQRVVGDSSQNLQQTINQLIELQKLGLQKNVAFSEAEQTNITNSLNLFLDNQKKYYDLNQSLAETLIQKQDLEKEKGILEQQLEVERQPAREQYEREYNIHRLKLAFFQLLVLVPIMLVAATLMVKKRTSIYFPLFLACGLATLIKVTLVLHEYFPTRYFKYIFIISLLLVVAKILIYFIRTIAYPKSQWLINQYREAYERFLCPVCEYPIRIGPRRFLFWTRRTVNKMVVPTEQTNEEEVYTCPACGSGLFEECTACHKVRHSLLPHCAHCGAEKAVLSENIAT